MSKLLPFPNRRREKEEASQWLARIDRGLTRAEQDALGKWLRDPRRREALFCLARDWDSMAVVEELAELFPLPKNEGVSRRFFVPVAAALVLIISVIAALVYIGPYGRGVPSSSGTVSLRTSAGGQASFTADYVTPIAQHRALELPDHSTIELNTNTQLHAEYSATARLVTLSHGEAIFKVAKDPNRVFTVRAGGYDFKAVGTAFDICSDNPCGLRVTVTQGRVRVHRTPPTQPGGDPRFAGRAPSMAISDSTDVLVEANKSVSIGARSERIDVLTPEEVADATAWQHGVLIFKKAPLAQVVEELARYSTVRMVISDPNVARLPVSGYFEVGDIDSLAAALEQNVGIKITKHDGYLLLSPSRAAQ